METQKFRHRIDEIEAVQITLDNIDELAVWCNGWVRRDPKASDPTDVYTALTVRTLRGDVDLTPGYWLIKQSTGRFEGMTDSNFQKKYEQRAPEILPEMGPDSLLIDRDLNEEALRERAEARRILFGLPKLP